MASSNGAPRCQPSLRTNRALPLSKDSSRKGPVPTALVKSVVSLGTVKVTSRSNIGSWLFGLGQVTTTALGPAALMSLADATGTLLAPPIPYSRRSDQTTSSEVTGLPSWNVALSAMVNVQFRCSASGSHLDANRGATMGSTPGTVNGS